MPRRPEAAQPEPGGFRSPAACTRPGYRGRLWTMRQYAGFGTAAESNRRYRYLLERGTTGLSVAFDLPTQIGYDSDDPHAAGRGGPRGRGHRQPRGHGDAARRHPARARLHLDDHQRHRRRSCSRSTSRWRAGAAIAEDALSGTVQNDILKEYVARGTYIYPPGAVAAPGHATCSPTARSSVPRWNTISISGYHIREAGATAPQEIAFTFAHALEYVRAARRGRPRPRALRRAALVLLRLPLRLHRGGGEVPRRAPAVGAAHEGDASASTNPQAQHLRFHVQTGGVTLTAQQPDNNVVRVALQALAAVLGGCQSLHTNAQGRGAGAAHRGLGAPGAAHAADHRATSRAWRTPSTRWAAPTRWRRPPTRSSAEARRAPRPRSRPRAARCAPSSAARSSARSRSRPTATSSEVEAGERVIVGVNRFAEDGEAAPVEHPAHRPRRSSARRSSACGRCGRGATPRAVGGRARRARGARRARARTWCRPMIDAVLAWATVGEIAGRLRAVFGEHRETLRPREASRRLLFRAARPEEASPLAVPAAHDLPDPGRERLRARGGRAGRPPSRRGLCGSRVAVGAARSSWPLALRRLAAARASVRGLREVRALPGLHPHLHEPARHHRLREPARRAPRPGGPRPRSSSACSPCVWAERFITPARTEVMQFLYLNFFWIAPSTSLCSCSQRRWPEFRAATLGVIVCFYLGYLLYVLFPAAPPRLVLVYEFTRTCSGYPAPVLEPVRARLRAAAGGQPRGLPLAARRGLAGRARLRLALRARLVLGAAAVRARACGSPPSTCATTTSVDLLAGWALAPVAVVGRAAPRRVVGDAQRELATAGARSARRWTRDRGDRTREPDRRSGASPLPSSGRSGTSTRLHVRRPAPGRPRPASCADARAWRARALIVNGPSGAAAVAAFSGTRATSLALIVLRSRRAAATARPRPSGGGRGKIFFSGTPGSELSDQRPVAGRGRVDVHGVLARGHASCRRS